MKLVALLLLASICTACGRAQQDTQMSVHDQRQTVLNRIADKCGLARSAFKLVGDQDLHVQPSSDTSYESLDCAFTELKRANLPVKMGFIGNEYYVGNEE